MESPFLSVCWTRKERIHAQGLSTANLYTLASKQLAGNMLRSSMGCNLFIYSMFPKPTTINRSAQVENKQTPTQMDTNKNYYLPSMQSIMIYLAKCLVDRLKGFWYSGLTC